MKEFSIFLSIIVILVLCSALSEAAPVNHTEQITQISDMLDKMEARVRQTMVDKKNEVNQTIAGYHDTLEEKKQSFIDAENKYHEKHGEAKGERKEAIKAAEEAFQKAMETVTEYGRTMNKSKSEYHSYKSYVPQAAEEAQNNLNQFLTHMKDELELINRIRDVLGVFSSRKIKELNEPCNEHYLCKEGLICSEGKCHTDIGFPCDTDSECGSETQCIEGICRCFGRVEFHSNGNEIYTGSKQQWEVPLCASKVKIEAYGAQGGGSRGGKGAYVSGIFDVNPGDPLNVMVGKQGGVTTQSSDFVGGGGGGSYVFRSASDDKPLIVAAGGGGQSQDYDGAPASHTHETIDSNGRGNGAGGTNGHGGKGGLNQGVYSSGGGGAGWLSDGENGVEVRNTEGKGGEAPRNGGEGGVFTHPNYTGGHGGYGGAGGGSDNTGAAGGGGGYNGGGGGNNYQNSRWGAGGGGGSYNGGSESQGETGTNTGDGKIIISPV
eukprot:gb/GECH01011428.1/.p1 GENE.gb/GECH01011428.1/~~gb/GECH01011428.1/.p1  ORF type:complete len:491 (+),score=146.83 gb/GECH01011428.1/:1-1473(+)